MTELIHLHLLAGWSGVLFGALSGAVMGLFFHREDWAGGYGSYPRRMMRLGHIAFFGIGILNLLYGLSLESITLSVVAMGVASKGLLTAAIAMPLVCMMAAWWKPFRHLFAIPVVGVFAGILPIVLGGLQS